MHALGARRLGGIVSVKIVRRNAAGAVSRAHFEPDHTIIGEDYGSGDRAGDRRCAISSLR
jgi:hypothetical protein